MVPMIIGLPPPPSETNTAGDAPVDAPVEATVEATIEAPGDAPVDAPVEATVEATIEAPGNAPVEATVEAPGDAPVETILEVPGLLAGEAPPPGLLAGDALGLIDLFRYTSADGKDVMQIDGDSSDSHVDISFMKPKYKGDHPCCDFSELSSTVQFVSTEIFEKISTMDSKLDQLLCFMRFNPSRSSAVNSGSQMYSAQDSDIGPDFGMELNEFQLQSEPFESLSQPLSPFQSLSQPQHQPAPLSRPQLQPAPLSRPKLQPAPLSRPQLQPAPLSRPQLQPAPLSRPQLQPAPLSRPQLQPAPLSRPQHQPAPVSQPEYQFQSEATTPQPEMQIAESSQIISELNTPGTKKGCTSHLGLSPNLLKLLQNESYSCKNFASNLVVKCFPREDIRVSNCAGVRGKKKTGPRHDGKCSQFGLRDISSTTWRKRTGKLAEDLCKSY